MKDVIVELIRKVFDFKTMIIILVVIGVLSYEQALVLLGVVTDTVLKFIGN